MAQRTINEVEEDPSLFQHDNAAMRSHEMAFPVCVGLSSSSTSESWLYLVPKWTQIRAEAVVTAD